MRRAAQRPGETPGGAPRICAACRETRLSRYNDQQVCASCVRAARDRRDPDDPGQSPMWVWGAAPMRRVLARGDLGAAVVIFRAAAGLSQSELADMTGWSQSMISLIESGQRDSLYDIRELLRFADAVRMPRTALLPLILGHPAVWAGPDGAEAAGPPGSAGQPNPAGQPGAGGGGEAADGHGAV